MTDLGLTKHYVSSICTVCNDMIQTHYTNTFTFDSTDLIQ